MTSERECYVFVVLPGHTKFIVAGRFRVSRTRAGSPLGEFVYGRSYLDRPDAVELDPVELRLTERLYRTGRMGGFFGVIRDSMPDHWHRMASALTLLRADESPTGRGRWSYLALADEVRRASESPREDLRELFGRMCFNAAVSNLDDHPRNHAMLARGTGWRLSPAYDLEPMPVVSVERRDLAMVCGPRGRLANKANLLAAAGRFLLDRDEAGTIFGNVTETIRASWRETMRQAGVGGRDCERIRSAFLYDGLFLDPQ